MQAVVPVMLLWSVLVPSRQWVAPSQRIDVTINAPGKLALLLADFSGSTIAPTAAADVSEGKTINLKTIYPTLTKPGAYLLFAVPVRKDAIAAPADFIGTPVVIEVRDDKRVGAPSGAMVTRLTPLQYVEMSTDAGDMTIAFYYDAAPVTIDNFLNLASQGF